MRIWEVEIKRKETPFESVYVHFHLLASNFNVAKTEAEKLLLEEYKDIPLEITKISKLYEIDNWKELNLE